MIAANDVREVGEGSSNKPGTNGRGLGRRRFEPWWPLSSVWFGIGILVMLFVYSSVGSAYPPLRQHWLIEKTEFEFFNWWPFTLMIALLVLNVVTVTLRKIPFNAINAGVWTIHTGIVVLALGSVYYFGTKLEGDTPIFRRRAVIRVPGQDPVAMIVRPGNRVAVGQGAGAYQFEIANVQPEYAMRTEGHEGEKDFVVQIMVNGPTGTFVRQVMANYPEFTEDVIPGKGRAVKETGKRLLDESLGIELALEPQTQFYLMDTSALYVRSPETGELVERPIKDLPHYHERIGSRDDVWLPEGEDMPMRPIDIEVAAQDDRDPLADYSVHVTGYLRYADEQPRWAPGGQTLNPVLGLGVFEDGKFVGDFELQALNPQKNMLGQNLLDFRWVESADALTAMVADMQPRLSIRVPSAAATLSLRAEPPRDDATDRPFTTIENSPYQVRIKRVLDVELSEGHPLRVVQVEVRKGDALYERWVASAPEATRDINPETRTPIAIDDDIHMSLDAAQAQVAVVTGPQPVGLQLVYSDGRGNVGQGPLEVGGKIPFTDRLEVEIRSLILDAREEVRPAVIPLAQRDRDAGKVFSMIKVEVAKDGWSTSTWLPYNQYPLPNAQYAVRGRIAHQTRKIRLPEGKTIELMYSRESHPLPAAVALEDFELLTFQGGLIGTNTNVRDYLSKLRFQNSDGSWSEPMRMSSNHPGKNNGFWYFQSTWDPPGRGHPGMMYTGAGVGNRNGVLIQLAGCCIAVMGMIYAFYVKPIIKRRRQAAARERVAGQRTTIAQAAMPGTIEEPVPVGGA